MDRRLFRVYVDESGDRGRSPRSSKYFVLAAVVVPDSHDHEARLARDQLCATLGKPTETVLHFYENVKKHEQRKVAAQALRGMPKARFIFVIVDKASLAGKHVLSDPAAMYNYALRRLLERISWLVDDSGGEAIITVAHVRRFPYERLETYITWLRANQTQIRWDAIRGDIRIEQQSNIGLLQAADLAAGCAWAALVPDRYGNVEGAYLLELAPRLYCPHGREEKVRAYGLHVVGDETCLEVYDWWPEIQTRL